MLQWYPGHMTKAKRNVQQHLKLVDVIFEIVDARIPYSSQNPDIANTTKDKPRIIILNKADLADPMGIDQWVKYFAQNGLKAIPMDSQKGIGLHQLTNSVRELLQDKLEHWKLRGRKPRPFRAMVLGIPNVGKSSLINKVAKKKSTKTGDKPGVTKGVQWVRLSRDIELLDMPGILWPKFQDEQVGYKLAITGAIAQHIFDPVEMIQWLLHFLPRDKKEKVLEDLEIQGREEDDDIHLLILDRFGKARGYLLPGGVVDVNKSAKHFLADYQKGKFGRITLEKPLIAE